MDLGKTIKSAARVPTVILNPMRIIAKLNCAPEVPSSAKKEVAPLTPIPPGTSCIQRESTKNEVSNDDRLSFSACKLVEW